MSEVPAKPCEYTSLLLSAGGGAGGDISDVAKLAVEGAFTGAQAREAMKGHVLAQAAITGRYTLNPAVKL